MGSSKIDPDLKRYAYLVLTSLREQHEGTEGTDYVPTEVTPGEIVVQEKNHGTGMHTFIQEDGPFFHTLTCVYVCTGRANPDTNLLQFDFGAQTLLNIVLMGWNGEMILKQQIHEVVDGIKALTEEHIHGTGGPLEDLLEKMDTYEKNLWRKH